MMLPTLLLVRAGSRRRFWIPLPVFLLWPAWLLAWLAWIPARLLGPGCARKLRLALVLMAQLAGLRVEVDGKDGSRVHLRFV